VKGKAVPPHPGCGARKFETASFRALAAGLGLRASKPRSPRIVEVAAHTDLKAHSVAQYHQWLTGTTPDGGVSRADARLSNCHRRCHAMDNSVFLMRCERPSRARPPMQPDEPQPAALDQARIDTSAELKRNRAPIVAACTTAHGEGRPPSHDQLFLSPEPADRMPHARVAQSGFCQEGARFRSPAVCCLWQPLSALWRRFEQAG